MNISETKDFLSQLPLPAAHFDPSGKVVFLNSAFTKLLGYTKADIPTVEAHWPIFFPDVAYREKVQNDWGAMLEESAKTGIPIQPMLLDIVAKNGEVKKLEVHSLQIETLAITMWIDFTEKIKSQARLQSELARSQELNVKLERAQNQLLQSDKMAAVGQLAAGVAHEINNPMGFVQSNLGTLKGYVKDLLEIIGHGQKCAERCALPGERDAWFKLVEDKDLHFIRTDVAQLLEESLDGADRVRRIVQDLKDFSHVSEDEWQWTDLHEGIDSTLNLVWSEIKYKAEVEKLYGEMPKVFCLASQLNQVFMNLLINAAQAIETRGKITIATGVEEGATPEDAKVRIEIHDTGKGIPPENLKRIFEPFFTTKPVGKGTGLGLSLAWSIVQKQKGTIEVKSEVGKGTTFRISLPVRGSDSSPAAN